MPQPSAAGHFPPDLRAAACEAYFQAYLSIHDVRLDRRGLVPLRSGPAGDAALTAAYNAFMAAHSRNGVLIGCLRSCSRRQYRQLLYRHFKTWAVTRQCPTKSRKRPVRLSAEEVRELVNELATPQRVGKSYIRFTTLDEPDGAAAFRPRVRALLSKSGVSPKRLHQWLLAHVPELQYKPEDRAPVLAPSTLYKRQLLSDILAKRRPWFSRLSHRARIVQESGSAHGDFLYHHAHDARDIVNVFFEQDFYSMFTFVIDAATFTDEEGDMHEHPKCYSSKTDVYPPHLVAGDPPISSTRSIMEYAVIHKYGGVIAGPDAMLTGSKLKQSTLPKDQQFEMAGLETW